MHWLKTLPHRFYKNKVATAIFFIDAKTVFERTQSESAVLKRLTMLK